jgi:hypothetical protein
MTDPQPAAPAAPASPSAPAPSAGAPATISDAAWGGMSWADRLNYSRASPEEQAQYRASIPSTESPAAGATATHLNEPLPTAQPAPDPAKPAVEYKVEHSPGFEAPPGARIDPLAPTVEAAKEFAAAHGLSQEAFSGLLDLYAKDRAGESQMIEQARQVEIAKLGSNAVARVKAVEHFNIAALGETKGRALNSMLVTADQIGAFETIASMLTAKNIGPYAPRATPSDGRVDEQTFDSMSSADRYAYARRFDQAQFSQLRRW